MERRKYHFIINPAASSGKGMQIWSRVEPILKREQVLYESHILHDAAEAEALVRDLTGDRSGYRETESLHNISEAAAAEEIPDCHIVVLGGDGTLNAVLNGIESFEHTVLSCIRTGSGNDFAGSMGISRDIEQAVHGILHHQKELVLDYGVITYRPEGTDTSGHLPDRRFIISSGIGYDADICEEVSRSRLKKYLNKVHLGKLVYVVIGIRQIFTRKSSRAVICMDNGERLKVPGLFFVVSMIHEKEGGGVPFCPGADAADGQLDICLVKNMPKWKLLLAVMLVYARKHTIFRNITLYRCKKITVRTEFPQWLHMDGETPCRIREAQMECRSGLRFLR
ncbi:MAG: hypothetical protein NC347_04225 [Clostridium sp.]|nr:hypothetical protein [Clostridium sp.]